MSLGTKDPKNIKCINRVVGSNESINGGKENWIIYTPHGLFATNFVTRYNVTNVGKPLSTKTIKWYLQYKDWIDELKDIFSISLMKK